MKIRVETERLRQLLEIAMIDKKLSDTIFRVTADGLSINESVKGIVVYANFNKSYFTEYTITQDENIMISQSIAKIFKGKAFKGHHVDITTTDSEIIIASGNDSYKEDLTIIDEARAAKKPIEFKSEVYGVVPAKNFDPIYLAKVKTEELSLPEYETYTITKNNANALVLSAKNVGEFQRVVTPIEISLATKDFTGVYDGSYFQDMIKQFLGTAYFGIDHMGPLFLTEKTPEYAVFYLLGQNVVKT